MGEYFNYKVRFRNGNLLDKLIQDGYAEYLEHPIRTIALDLQKIDEQNIGGEWFKEALPDKYQETTTFLRSAFHNNPKIIIGLLENRDGIFYTNKWDPNVAIPIALSKLYPDEIIEYEESATYAGYQGTTHYFQDGRHVNREGEMVITALDHVNPKFIGNVNPETGMVTINAPVGNGRNRFGTFEVPEKNVSGLNGVNNVVYFTKESVTVTFGDHTTKECDSIGLVKKFWDNIKSYKDYAKELLYLEKVPRNRLIDNGEYYILTIHVPAEVSQDGQLSTTVPKHDVDENGRVYLGERMKEKNIQFMMEDRVQRKPMKVGDIKKLFDENEQDRTREREGDELEMF